jgi:Zn finger protein HypA/HybF involved in hydrogenase expression
MKIYCKNCQHSFNAEKMPLKCPLCGEGKIEKEKSVEELLQEE